jgi:hypothetical protein
MTGLDCKLGKHIARNNSVQVRLVSGVCQNVDGVENVRVKVLRLSLSLVLSDITRTSVWLFRKSPRSRRKGSNTMQPRSSSIDSFDVV